MVEALVSIRSASCPRGGLLMLVVAARTVDGKTSLAGMGNPIRECTRRTDDDLTPASYAADTDLRYMRRSFVRHLAAMPVTPTCTTCGGRSCATSPASSRVH